MLVEQLELSVRTMNCLRRGGITTVGELIGKGEGELLSLHNFGQKSMKEVKERLETLGLSLTPVVGEKVEAEEEEA
jgi:DNA-directed RNA polymerase subunit alpha